LISRGKVYKYEIGEILMSNDYVSAYTGRHEVAKPVLDSRAVVVPSGNLANLSVSHFPNALIRDKSGRNFIRDVELGLLASFGVLALCDITDGHVVRRIGEEVDLQEFTAYGWQSPGRREAEN